MEEIYRCSSRTPATPSSQVRGQREIYIQSLESGEIDVVPDYAATTAEFLNHEANGADAEPPSPPPTPPRRSRRCARSPRPRA